MPPNGDAVNGRQSRGKEDDLEAVMKQLGAGIENLLSMVDRGLCGEPLETPRAGRNVPPPPPPPPAVVKPRSAARKHANHSQSSGLHPQVSAGFSKAAQQDVAGPGSVWSRLHSNGKGGRERGQSMRSGSPTWAGGLRGEKKKSASPMVGRQHRVQQRSISAEPGKSSRRAHHSAKRAPSSSVTRTMGKTVVLKPELPSSTSAPVPVVSPTLAPSASPPILDPPPPTRPTSISRSTTPVRKPGPPPIVGDPTSRSQPDILTIIDTQKRKADGVGAKVSTHNYVREDVEEEKEVVVSKTPFKIPKLTLGGVIEKKQTDPTFTYEKFLTITTGEDDIRAVHEVIIDPKKPVEGEEEEEKPRNGATPPPSYESLQAPPPPPPSTKPKIPSLSLKTVNDKKKSDPSFTYEKFLTMTTGETDLRAEA